MYMCSWGSNNVGERLGDKTMNMRKWIIRDYIQGFRWENIKKYITANGIFTIIYIGFILPSIWGMFEKPQGILGYAPICLGAMFTVVSGLTHSMVLSKQMYMCPIDRGTRRKYIKKAAIFRILFTTGVNVVIYLALILTGVISTFGGCVMMLNSLILSMAMCGYGRRDRALQDDKWGKNHKSGLVCGGFIIFFSLIVSFLEACYIASDVADRDWWDELIFLIVIVVIEVPLTIKNMTYWYKEIDMATEYESR